ncbi:MAG: hypothetical protein Q4D02_05165 [Clostridia bacterium]|nr:hypothetical protein [Clostridia bacterium]
MEEQVTNLTKDLREYSENMSERLKSGINLDQIELEMTDAERVAIINTLYADGTIQDLDHLTPEENTLVEQRVEAAKDTVISEEILKQVREVSGEFFKREQKLLEAMQKQLDKLKEEAQKEAEKVEQEIKALEDKQRAHEENSENPELTEAEQKSLAELTKKREYFKTKFPEQLKVMGQRMSHARETITYQKEALNVTCQERFGGWAVRNSKKREDEEREGQEQNGGRQDREGHEQGEGQEGGQNPGAGQQGQPQGQQQGGGQRQQGGGAPVAGGGAPAQQQGQPQQGQPQQPGEEEHVPTEEEILGETDAILKFNGTEMTARQALEYMRKYSTFTPEQRKICLKHGGLEIIEKATKTLDEKGSELSQADRNLLSEYASTISDSTMEMADLVAKDSKKPDGRHPLSLVLKMDNRSPEFKELQKYFDPNTGWKFWQKKPQVIYDYDNIPEATRKMFDKAIEDFKESQEEASQEIEKMRAKLKDPATSKEEKDSLKETINLMTERMADDNKGFERVFGSVVRTGKALALTKEIERVAEKVKADPTRRQEAPEEEPDLEEDLSGQTRDDEDILDEREEKINAKFDREREIFRDEIQAKIDAGEELTFEDYAKYNQYIAYGVPESDLPDIDEANIPEVVTMRDRIDAISDKASAIDDALARGEAVTDDMLLTEEEMHIMIGTGRMNASGPRMERYCSETTRDSYQDQYDLRKDAEKKVEAEERTANPNRDNPDRENSEEPVV